MRKSWRADPERPDGRQSPRVAWSRRAARWTAARAARWTCLAVLVCWLAADSSLAQQSPEDATNRPTESEVPAAQRDKNQSRPLDSAATRQTAEEVAWFERRVRPLLASQCFECHSARSDDLAAGLRLDRRALVLQGGDLGPAVVPGKPEASLLIQAARYADATVLHLLGIDHQRLTYRYAGRDYRLTDVAGRGAHDVIA